MEDQLKAQATHPARLGPRPLPLHLANQAMSFAAAESALTSWKGGSLNWKPHLQPKAQSLLDAVSQSPSDFAAFRKAVRHEALNWHAETLAGVAAYRASTLFNQPDPAPIFASQGSTLLRRRPPADPKSLPVLLIPSLINRAHILDFWPEQSFMRVLAAQGLDPWLMDWDEPGPQELGFDLDQYIERLEWAFDLMAQHCQATPAILGYCMGGTMAVALANRVRPSALVLMAAPWDFAPDRAAHIAWLRLMSPMFQAVIDTLGHAPVDLLSSMFATLDPTLMGKKFRRFASTDPESDYAKLFVALEDWTNDGTPLAGPVARECLFQWYLNNTPVKEQWRIKGDTIRLSHVRCPTRIIIPAQDRIVPPGSQAALSAITGSEIQEIRGGHVAMLFDRDMESSLCLPLSQWLVHMAVQQTGCAKG